MARVRMLRGPICSVPGHELGKKHEHRVHRDGRHGGQGRDGEARTVCAVTRSSARKREDEEAALAGDDDGEEAAVGRNVELAKGESVKDGGGDGLRDGDVLAGRVGAEGR
jgi:hypothetical protein